MLDWRNDHRIVDIADHYGYNAQSRQLVEEMAELTAAVNRVWRKVLRCGELEFTADEDFRKEALRTKEMKNLITEVADVEVCLAQLRYMIDLDALIDAEANMKLSRQIGRIILEQQKVLGKEAEDGI